MRRICTDPRGQEVGTRKRETGGGHGVGKVLVIRIENEITYRSFTTVFDLKFRK